ncbi:uncharacterized protein LOC105694253 [Orussus abietinus]|uniref:uncharacterized protein LOC105694253 n=1 Tax=Orussus abietinus TaxID=222816 RepID=UPI0006262257|nr:uncharacterized protein LOC105694253 [Orussus abietinus]
MRKVHIDDVQPATVDDHFDAIMAEKEDIDPNPSEITPDDMPEWFNEELFRRGQQYYRRNKLAMGGASTLGLVAVLVIPTILKVLTYTKSSSTPCTAFKRYLETVLHTNYLYTCDFKDPNSKLYKSLNVIRYKHCINSRRSVNGGAGAITQKNMVLTQFGFLGYALLRPKELSLTNEPEEREGLNHLWRVVGHMIGIPDRLNLCRKNEAETTKLCERLMKEVFAKHMKEDPPNFREMTSIMLDGLRCVDVLLDADAFLAFTYEMTDLKYQRPLGLYSTLNFMFRSTLFTILGLPYIGVVLRVYYNYYLAFNYWLQERWQLIAWLRFGKQNVHINVHPKLK